ncbi:MAG TPA: DUF402 domain-containing protein [Dermatophilaceae bacterium]|nr:DUF402 domain-containing protein [Dermatophilaceae bacterium]
MPRPGQPVHVAYRKHDGSPHWQVDTEALGIDEHGLWLRVPTGTTYSRPALSVTTTHDQLMLVPLGRRWLATFHARPDGRKGVVVYVDITSPCELVELPETPVPGDCGLQVQCVDLDLDVIRLADGTTYVDDEDEFAEHTVRFGYDAPTVAATRHTADEVWVWVSGEVAPFDPATRARWFALLGGAGTA